jgi:hypothetical protein
MIVCLLNKASRNSEYKLGYTADKNNNIKISPVLRDTAILRATQLLWLACIKYKQQIDIKYSYNLASTL